jgi:predicted enzyme related to lactoylglutathione lyase
MMPAIATFAVAALDCPDPLALARFYSDLTGWDIAADSDSSWAQLDSPTGASIAFQGVDDHRPPKWPGSEHPQQLHLDFDVPDLDAGEQAVLAIGATKADVQPGTTFRVFLDPAGHPFCLCKE